MDEITLQQCHPDDIHSPSVLVQLEPVDGEHIKSCLSLKKASRAGGPVTCVSLKPILRAGASTEVAKLWALGPYLFCSRGVVQQELLVFPETQGGSIHGISFREEDDDLPAMEIAQNVTWDAVVFGGRLLAFCNILVDSTNKNEMKRVDVHHDGLQKPVLLVSDWIWDVHIFTNQGEKERSTVVVGMARHTVELWSVNLNATSESSFSSSICVTCQRRISGFPSCLVMSMNILKQGDRLWVAAGTAFQVIQVWSLSIEDESLTETAPNCCLEGHAGVIHAVQFSHDGQYIASASDDRSVRLWTCRQPTTSWSAQWVGWGHTARVWSVGFAPNMVVSVAEDATTRIWSIESGILLSSIQHSTGLWSIATWNDVAMVGATDGTVSVYNLRQRIPVTKSTPIPDDRLPRSTTIVDFGATISLDLNGQTKKKKNQSKIPSQVIVGLKWMGRERILIATRSGSLMAWNVSTQEWELYEPWWDPILLDLHQISSTDGCCMTIFGDWVAIGTTGGDVICVQLCLKMRGNQPLRTVLSAKSLKSVQGLHFITERSILISFHVRSVALWAFIGQPMAHPTLTLTVETKGVPLSCAFDADQRQFLVGDTRGNIGLFEIPPFYSDDKSANVKASSVLTRVHKKEHVTSIALYGNKILSSGNDGCIHTSYRKGSVLWKGISVPVSSFSGISRIWLQNTFRNSENCIIAGYYGNIFRVFNVSQGYDLFRVDTGGRQRINDLFFEPDLKALAVCINHKDGSNEVSIQRETCKIEGQVNLSEFDKGIPVHGETIFDSCFFSLDPTERVSFLLTASEDCSSKVFLCHENRITDVHSLTPQESCVRAVCTSQIDKTSALLVVGGGKLSLQFFLAKSNSTHGTSVASLKDVAFTFVSTGHNRMNTSTDQRINAVKAAPLDGPGRSHVIVAGDSAGQFHVHIVSEDMANRPQPGLVVQGSSRPILCIALSPIHDRILVAAGTTAGDVVLYDVLPQVEAKLKEDWLTIGLKQWIPFFKFQAHQVGTNAISLSINATRETTALATIVTGGDDQAMTLCQIHLNHTLNDDRIQAGKHTVTTHHDASSSALKGVSEILHESTLYFLTAGYTQRLALWKLIEVPGDGSRLEIVQHLPVDVGDVNVLATCRQKKQLLAVVAGLGIEIFTLTSFKNHDEKIFRE